jgi:radical SAM superfamily enzyme YgiQ (UPF0313 family)
MGVWHQEKLLFESVPALEGAIATIWAFPNEYSVGITSLGYQVIWAILARRADIEVARLFTDCHEPLPRHPELVGFSLSWELDYTHVLSLLELLGIPRRDRLEEHPLVFGGGPVLTANPEPFADFFDVVLLGDGEDLIPNFLDAYAQVRGEDRPSQLRRLARVPGVYVPSLYEVTYCGEAIASITPKAEDVPAQITKQTYRGNTLSVSTVVTEQAAWPGIYMVEVVRSCPEMCRFCLASYLTLPFRAASLEKSLVPAIDRGLTVTDRIGLLGASVTQHPEFVELLDHLNQPRYSHLRLSIASVRTNTVTEQLAATLAKLQTTSITIAIESGSERLRQIVNKKLTNPEILQAAANAKAGGLKAIKFYGMVGIPGETMADLEATVELLIQVKKAAPGLKLTLGCSTFVPKAHTPFQWCGVDPQSEKRLKWLEKQLCSQGIGFRPESYNWSVIQALISRGDRRLGPLLELARTYGNTLGSYRRASKELKGKVPSLDYYIHQNWPVNAVLPWHHLHSAVPTGTIAQHWQTTAALINPELAGV